MGSRLETLVLSRMTSLEEGETMDISSMGLILIELLVPFSTQSERLIKFNEAKKGDLPGSLLQQESSLVSRMLHQVPDGRPEIGDILGLSWLEEVSRRSERR